MSQNLDVFYDLTPFLCGHIRRVQQRTVLHHGVDDPLVVFTNSERDKYEPEFLLFYREIISEMCRS